MSKASPDESFVYADADGNEEVSEKEPLAYWIILGSSKLILNPYEDYG